MTLCRHCIEAGACSVDVALSARQLEYLDMEQFQTPSWNWIASLEGFLNRIEAFGCTNEEVLANIQLARDRIALAKQAQEVPTQTG